MQHGYVSHIAVAYGMHLRFVVKQNSCAATFQLGRCALNTPLTVHTSNSPYVGDDARLQSM